ncbi:hypothetical protein MGA5115_00843 [Marinomonas gallaica]|uniref:SMI1 / KNR4 family protein n=1 Tax=Marinomonas gallaica TaxID=1806667 RepID=A0A1C3JNZ3_9GAMM|nr:SMI1/KNR4 family protein [Marinomonas gallaica]SBT16759.1 hypothetical protein MGA5115_00843 [Marinomonas gallaica]SBT20475.1 hypothetical protein MGA5116_01061 [Marinomonas gallaica]
MLDKTEISRSINRITSNEYYEGDFGDCVEDIDKILNDVDKSLWESIPKEYIEFLSQFGFGELDAAFYLDDGPIPYTTIFNREIDLYKGMYVFAGNSSDILYAFDSLNNWRVVTLGSEALEVTKVADSFEEFIVERLGYIEELAESRLDS